MMLEGKIAVVTGGRGGIGRAICQRFEKEGATVYAADLSAGGSLAADDAPGHFLSLDVTSEDSVRAAMETVASQHSRLDVLVNAAGIEIEETIENTSLEQWNRIFAVGDGYLLGEQHALPLLRQSTQAAAHPWSILVATMVSLRTQAGYCATKGAVHAPTRGWRVTMVRKAFG